MKNADSKFIINSIFGQKMDYLKEKDADAINKVLEQLNDSKIISLEDFKNDSDKAQIIMFEKPDLLVVLDDFIIGVEHFKVDSSKTTRKGSKYKSKYNDNHFNGQFESLSNNLGVDNKYSIKTEKISTDLKYNQLLENTISNFDNHYKKITGYKKNIKEKLKIKKNIKIIFFIEYDVIFPSFIEDESNKYRAVFPDNDKEFIKYLEDKDLLDGLIFHYQGDESFPKKNKFIYNNKDNLLEHKKDDRIVYDLKNIKVHNFKNPMITLCVRIVVVRHKICV